MRGAPTCDPLPELQCRRFAPTLPFRFPTQVMKLGDRNRAVGVTDMNAHSSRSHAVFIVNVECAENDEAGESHIR